MWWDFLDAVRDTLAALLVGALWVLCAVGVAVGLVFLAGGFPS